MDTRENVAIDLGYTEVPCAMVDVDKTREKALNIALNKISGEWDENLLADLLKDIQDSNFDLGFTGFEPPEIETLFNKIHSKDVKEDNFDVEAELSKPVFSYPGDLWCLGKHRFICGDSTLEETYASLMDEQQANLVLTDPPYNVNYGDKSEMLDDYLGGARNNNHIMNDNMSDSDFHEFLLTAYKQMHDNLAKDGSIYVFHAETEGVNFRTAFLEAEFRLSSCCIWKKNALVLGRSSYQWIHEPVLFGWNQTWTECQRLGSGRGSCPAEQKTLRCAYERVGRCQGTAFVFFDYYCRNRPGEYLLQILTGILTSISSLDTRDITGLTFTA